MKEEMLKNHKKLKRFDLMFLFNEYKELTTSVKVDNFHSSQEILNSYIDFETNLEKNDVLNKNHNFGRFLIIPFDEELFSCWKKKDQEKIISKTLNKLTYSVDLKKNVKFFAWIEDSFLKIVFLERCKMKNNKWSVKNTWFKSIDYFWKSTFLILSKITRLTSVFEMRQNVKMKIQTTVSKRLKSVVKRKSLICLLFGLDNYEGDMCWEVKRYYKALVSHKKLNKRWEI